MKPGRWRSTAVLPTVLLVLLLHLAVVQVDAYYILRVKVDTYNNPQHEDFNGGCCEPSCSDCDNYFEFCLRRKGWSMTSVLCPLGFRSSEGASISDDSLTFGSQIASNLANPVVFTGNNWEGAFQLRVSIKDNDGDADDLVDRIFAEMDLQVSDSFTTPAPYTGFYNKATMTMSFKVECAQFYYGANCRTFCQPTDDSSGHYSCDENGGKVCLPEWMDVTTNCITPVPVCTEGCHEIGGYCVVDGECRCNTGWSGALCDVCTPATDCDHGTCTLPNECNCDTGYSGTLCTVDDDVCGHLAPCLNGATCINQGPDDYMCICAPGYTGDDCATNIDDCLSTPCKNLGVCMDLVNGFECDCATGWGGDTCEINIDECSTVAPCVNGGTCMDCVPTDPVVVDPSSSFEACPIGYRCDCPPLYYGDNCEFEHNPCSSNNCTNGARCVDISEMTYHCECSLGYTGQFCETEIDECQPNPCQNGANCTDAIGNYTCTCQTGFTGPHCEINIDDCIDNECTVGPTHSCIDGNNTYECRCHPGYTGKFCETNIDDCDPSGCLEGATCEDLVNDFKCVCPPGYTGALCMENIDDCVHPDLCLNNGVCVDEVNDYSCSCLPGWTGQQCETESLSPCEPNPCPQGMACVERLGDTAQEYICEECHQGEEGCNNATNAETQGGNGSSDDLSGDKIGGIVGGVVAGILLFLLLIVCCLCCYLKGCCFWCCPCVVENKEETSYDVWQGGVAQNPVYMGPNTVLRNARGTLPKYSTDSLTGNDRNHQNPMYAISQLSHNASSTPPPLPPMRTGSRDPLISPSPKLAFGRDGDEHPYDTIPAFKPGASPPPSDLTRTSMHYYHLMDTTDGIPTLPGSRLGATAGPAPMMASGKYDHLEGGDNRPTTQTGENLYVVDPSLPGVVLPGAMVQMPAESGDDKGTEKGGLDVETIHLDMPGSTKSPYDP